MKIRNVSGRAREIVVGDLSIDVDKDQVFEVDDALGRSLCEQPDNFVAVAEKAKDKE